MASELSRLIEDELRHKGYYVGGEEEVEEEPDPNQALMGALRVEVRTARSVASIMETISGLLLAFSGSASPFLSYLEGPPGFGLDQPLSPNFTICLQSCSATRLPGCQLEACSQVSSANRLKCGMAIQIKAVL